jgi:hypothetical protein
MAAPVPLRADYDAPLLRGLARSAVDPGQVRRLLALAAIYGGCRAGSLRARSYETCRGNAITVSLESPASIV